MRDQATESDGTAVMFLLVCAILSCGVLLAACSSGAQNATTTAYARVNSTAYAQFSTALAAQNPTVGAPATVAVNAEVRPSETPTTPPSAMTPPAGIPTAVPTTDSPVSTGTSAPTLSPLLRTYVDEQGRFSFLIPDGWHVVAPHGSGVAMQIVSDDPPGNANLVAEPVAASTTLDQYVDATIREIHVQYPQLQLGPAGVQKTTVGAQEARWYELVGIQQGIGVHIAQYVTLYGDAGYVLTVTSGDRDARAMADRASVMLETFTFRATT